MKNVLVFVLPGGERYAIELRWVREVFTLAHLTPVPTAPPSVVGVVNYKGAIVTVLHGPPLLAAVGIIQIAPGARPARLPRAGDALVLLDVEGTRAALAVDRIDSVTSLSNSADGALVDADGKTIPIIDPPVVMAMARQLVTGAALAAIALLGAP